MQSPQVLVVGSGPSGLAAAYTLAKNGIPVRIIEKDPQHHNGFRGSGIHPRTQEFEYFLGILDDVEKHSFDLGDMHIYNPEDPFKKVKTQILLEKVEPTPAFPFTRPFSVAQYLHQAVWRKHLEGLGVGVELGSAATAIEQDEEGVTVDITKTSGGTEVIEKARFEYVIGADGGHSSVRKILGLSFVGETREADSVYIADVRVKGFTELDMHYFGQLGGDFTVLLYTGQPGRYQIMFRGSQADMALLNANRDRETLQAEFWKHSNRKDVEIQEVLWQAEWRPNIRMAERFRVGRVFLAGDAAHAHSPAGGQGMNSSIGDSRESRAMQLAREAAQQKEEAAKAFGYGDGQNYLRGWKLFQLDLNYRHSPFVKDDRYVQVAGGKSDTYGQRGHDIRAGDRAPDAPGLVTLVGEGKKTRLFDLFDPTKHIVLIFSTATSMDETRALTQPVLESLKRLTPELVRTVLIVRDDAADAHASYSGVDYVLKDAEGYAFKNYDIEDGKSSVVVVRPDSYIGAFTFGAPGVQQYLDTVFGPVSAS